MTHEHFEGIASGAWEPVWPEPPVPGLAVRAARDHALRRLFDYLAGVRFRIAGRKDGTPIEYGIERNSMFEDQPDRDVDFQFPAIGVLPAKTEEECGWLGPPVLLEESFGKYGFGTVLVEYGELVEEVTLDVWSQYSAQRRSIQAAFEGSVFHTEAGPLYLTLPDYYDQIVVFEYGSALRFDGDEAAQGRRQMQVTLEMRVPAVFLTRAVMLRPNIQVEAE